MSPKGICLKFSLLDFVSLFFPFCFLRKCQISSFLFQFQDNFFRSFVGKMQNIREARDYPNIGCGSGEAQFANYACQKQRLICHKPTEQHV